MSWDDRRGAGAVATAVRQTAHSDDAKHRTDETTHLRARAKWVVPVAVGVAVLLLGGGVAVAVAKTNGSPARSARGNGSGGSAKGSKGTKGSKTVTPLPHGDTATGTAKAIYYGTGITGGPWKGTLAVDCTATACTVSKFLSPTATQLFGFRMLHAKAMHLTAVGTDSYAGTAAHNNSCDRPPDRSKMTLSGDQVHFIGYWHGPPSPIPHDYLGCMNDGAGRFEFVGQFTR